MFWNPSCSLRVVYGLNLEFRSSFKASFVISAMLAYLVGMRRWEVSACGYIGRKLDYLNNDLGSSMRDKIECFLKLLVLFEDILSAMEPCIGLFLTASYGPVSLNF